MQNAGEPGKRIITDLLIFRAEGLNRREADINAVVDRS